VGQARITKQKEERRMTLDVLDTLRDETSQDGARISLTSSAGSDDSSEQTSGRIGSPICILEKYIKGVSGRDNNSKEVAIGSV